MFYVTFTFAVNILLYATVIHCDKKPLYHEPSKKVFRAGISLPRDALFGYSITYQAMRKKIIISAPRADTQGEVFECDLTQDACSKVYINIGSILVEPSWLGAAVRAGSDFFMICAPRYISKTTGTWHVTKSQCFYQSARSGLAHKLKQELQNKQKYYSNMVFFNDTDVSNFWHQKFDTLGWSMDVSTDDVTIVGGPGAAMGRAMLIPKRKSEHPILIDLIRNYSDTDSLVSYEFGYSVKAGKFLGTEVFAISSPYGEMGRGKVLFYSKDRDYMQAVVDSDIGSIFGGALCNARLGGADEALLVGAPASAQGGDEVDVGAVHVYINVAGKMRRKRTIRGYRNNGYFGYAIASVGDLNLDNKDEAVISAPYENDYRGAVYIFSGADLVRETSSDIQWVQRIEGDMPGQMLGLSISAVKDLDGNGCKELSIGLPGNNSAILMRCMAFITLDLDPMESNIDVKVNSTSVYMNMCIKLTYGEKLSKIDNYVAMTIKLIHPNASIVDSKNNILTYDVSLADMNSSYCRNVETILPVNGNYEKEIVLQMNASLSGEDPRNFTKLKSGLVMLTDESQTYLEKKLLVRGSNLIMHLSTSFNNTSKGYMIGSTKSEVLIIEVQNAPSSRGGAYDACMRVHIQGVGIALSSTNCAPAGDTITCVPSDPIFPGKSMISTVTLDTESLTGEVETVEFEARLFKQCDDSLSLIESKKTSIPLQRDVNITLAGESIPSAVNVSREEIAFGYEDIRHVYSILNGGETSWGKISCTIRVPQYVHVNVSTNPHERECTWDHSEELVTCVFSKLARHTKTVINIFMDVLPKTHFTAKVLKGNAELETQISCMVADKKHIQRITTTLHLLHTSVPLWVLVIAIIVGLLILLIVAFILYECGFLRRKHKEELAALKKDVRRQSIRRSMRLPESMTADDILELNKEDDEIESSVTMGVEETTIFNIPHNNGPKSVVADVH